MKRLLGSYQEVSASAVEGKVDMLTGNIKWNRDTQKYLKSHTKIYQMFAELLILVQLRYSKETEE